MSTFLDYALGGVGPGTVVALLALALVLTWRSTRIVNFAQVGQAMFTTFIALAIQELTGSWVLALAGAMVAGAVLGLFVQVLVLRPVRRSDTSGAIIATFGVLIVLQSLAAMIWGGDPQSFPTPVSNAGIEVGDRVWPISPYDLLILGTAAVLVVALTLLFTRTGVGLAMRATAFNPEVARLSGVRVGRMLGLGWALAGLVGAVAGVLVAPSATLSPNSYDILLVFAFTAAVVGGLDSLVGAVFFGVMTGVILGLVTGYSDSSSAPVAVLVLLAANLWLKPEGFFGRGKARVV
jgi:branched-chain amino acid transport system permease protein